MEARTGIGSPYRLRSVRGYRRDFWKKSGGNWVMPGSGRSTFVSLWIMDAVCLSGIWWRRLWMMSWSLGSFRKGKSKVKCQKSNVKSQRSKVKGKSGCALETSMVYVGADLGKVGDPSALAVVEREDLLRAWQTPLFRGLQVRYLERIPLGTPYTAVVERLREMM